MPRLKRIRKQRKLSLKEVAERLGVSARPIPGGARNQKTLHRQKICRGSGVLPFRTGRTLNTTNVNHKETLS